MTREQPGLRDPDRFDAWLQRLLVNASYAEARRWRSWSVPPEDRASVASGETCRLALRGP